MRYKYDKELRYCLPHIRFSNYLYVLNACSGNILAKVGYLEMYFWSTYLDDQYEGKHVGGGERDTKHSM